MISKYDFDFSKEVSKILESSENDEELQKQFEMPLKGHQLNLLKYFNPTTPIRGLVLYHGVGSGKTISSIAISKSFSKVIVMVPGKQLEDNFKAEMKKTLPDYNDFRVDYKFIRYSGLRKEKLDTFISTGLLNDSLVIVDEAHNVIRMISNYLNSPKKTDSVIGKGLYDLFTKSERARFLFLSATPILNTTKEIAVMLNILTGNEQTISFNLKTTDTDTVIEENIRKFPYIDYISINSGGVTVSKTPFGFSKSKSRLELNRNAPINDTLWLRKFEHFMMENGYKIHDIAFKDNELFPLDDSFDKTFINSDYSLKNSDLFFRRAAGLISSIRIKITKSIDGQFVESKTITQRGYPKTIVHPIKKLGMSVNQFIQYSSERNKEINDDTRRQIRAASIRADVLNDSGTVRARSGALCNFSFPQKIVAENRITTKATRSDVIEKMRSDLGNYLNELNDDVIDDECYNLSPKYNDIINQIKSKTGTSVVYSHLVNREGITAMFEMMKRKGFKKFDLYDDDFDDDSLKFALYGENKENDEYIRHIFNSDESLSRFKQKSNLKGKLIKALFITSSGAEGITLKNVRNLFIIEHHWSEIRIDQVIGRVSRFNSHIALPEDERTVEVHKYVTTFDGLEEKLGDSNSKLLFDQLVKLKVRDRNKTTDEYILDVAYKKKRIADEMLELIRNSSIDCSLNYTNTSQCRLEYIHAKNQIPFVPNFNENLKFLEKKKVNRDEKKINLKKTVIPKRKWIPSKYHEKTVFIDKKTFEAYEKKGDNYVPLKFILNLKEKVFKILLE